MKPINSPLSAACRKQAYCVLETVKTAVALSLLPLAADAADVTLTTANGFGASSFDSALNWSNGLAPAAGNAYFVNTGSTLRTPADSALSYTFGGDSLTMTGSSFLYKGAFTAPATAPVITVNNLTLNGATVTSASNNSTAFVLAGNAINITGAAATTFFSNNATMTVAAPITGSGGSLSLQTNNTPGRQVVLGGANTYTGPIAISGASGVALTSTGKLSFALGGTGAFNTISGSAPFTFDGMFAINLAGTSNVIGTTYTLVDNATVVETYGAGFTIEGWTKVGNAWISPSGDYQFLSTTGVLTRIDPDTDFDGLADSWEISNFSGIGLWSGGDDPDSDYCTNLQEFTAGTNPNVAASFPDGDSDGLPDGWELAFFGNLTALATGDADGDFSSNAAEYAALTDPTSRYSFPDSDGDQVGDGWEAHYFDSTSACDPAADPDGDLSDNSTEFYAGTSPENQMSSPDFDTDGLPDGWEVHYFRLTGEALTEACAHTDGSADSDGDGKSDRVEYHLGTDPKTSGSGNPTLAYWRFEEKTAGTVAAQPAVEVLDVSGNGNNLLTWADYTSPGFSTRVSNSSILNTGAMNLSSLGFAAVAGNRYTSDNIYTVGTAPINTAIFSSYTVEAAFRTTLANTAQGIIGKGGNPTGAAAPYQAPFTLKLNAANQVVAGMVDSTPAAHEVISTRTITTGSWYSAAVTVSSSTLSLWLKAPGDTAYVLEASTAINGAYPASISNAAWVVGQTEYNAAGNFVGFDSFTGDLDEIRISGGALASGSFLANTASAANPDSDGDGMTDTWETTYFAGLGQAATGDFDNDGTDNLTEFRLGLLPNQGSSSFAATMTAGVIKWPSVTGIGFTIQRSTDLRNWSTIATVTDNDGDPATASFTDPSPPSGKAFYKVFLNP